MHGESQSEDQIFKVDDIINTLRTGKPAPWNIAPSRRITTPKKVEDKTMKKRARKRRSTGEKLPANNEHFARDPLASNMAIQVVTGNAADNMPVSDAVMQDDSDEVASQNLAEPLPEKAEVVDGPYEPDQEAAAEDNQNLGRAGRDRKKAAAKDYEHLNSRQRANKKRFSDLATYLLRPGLPQSVLDEWIPTVCSMLRDDPAKFDRLHAAKIEVFLSECPSFESIDDLYLNVVQMTTPWQWLELISHGRKVLANRNFEEAAWSRFCDKILVVKILPSLESKTVAKLWYTLNDSQAKVLAEIVCACERPLNLKLLDRILIACKDTFAKVKADQLVKFFGCYAVDTRASLIRKFLKLRSKWPDIIAANLEEYLVPSCFALYNDTAVNDDAIQLILKKIKGVTASHDKLMTFFAWFQHDWVKCMLQNIAKSELSISFEVIANAIKLLEGKLAQASLQDHGKLLKKYKAIESSKYLQVQIQVANEAGDREKEKGYDDMVRSQIRDQEQLGINLEQVEQQVNAESVKHAAELFQRQRGYTLHDWQRTVVALFLSCYKNTDKPIMMNLPTGLGKSIISYVLALVLNRETKKKVLLVTQTKFGKHTGYNRYAVGEQSAKYPSPLLGTKVVWHITFQELAMVADKINCEDYICIIDEVDQLVEHLLDLARVQGKDKFIARALHVQLAKFNRIIGLSGSIQQTMLEKLFLGSQLKNQVYFTLSPRRLEQLNKVDKKVVIASEADRVNATANHVLELANRGTNIVLIVDRLRQNIAKWRKVLPASTYYLHSWNDPHEFPNHEQFLASCKGLKQSIVVTDLDGARGTDLQLGAPPQIVISVPKLSYALLLQCLGRGSRSADQITFGSVILHKKDDVPDVTKIDEYLLECQAANIENSILKTKVANRLDGATLTLNKPTKVFLEKVFLTDEPLHHNDSAPSPTAIENWKALRTVLSDHITLPEHPDFVLYDN